MVKNMKEKLYPIASHNCKSQFQVWPLWKPYFCKLHFTVCTIYSVTHLLQNCRNPSLGLATKARGCKVAGQKGDLGVKSHAPKSAKSVRE
jgi:hypothetical protein